MQKIIQWSNILCVLIVLFIACTVNEGIYGEWRNSSGVNLFNDTVNIVKLRTREGSNFPYYTVIYDVDSHASACQTNSEGDNICLSMLLKTSHVHPSDEISSLVAAPLEDKSYILSTDIEHHLGYSLLYWKMRFPNQDNNEIVQVFRRDWF